MKLKMAHHSFMLNKESKMINNYYNYNNNMNYKPAISDTASLVSQIGQKTVFYNTPGNIVGFNYDLINKVINKGSEAIPYLIKLLNTTNKDTEIVEAAFIVQKLAEYKTPGYEAFYSALQRHNSHPCPVVQVYVAGAYREIGEPSAAGPLTRMLNTNLKYPPGFFTFDPTEEIAGSLIELIAQRASININKKLEPRLSQIESKLNITA